MRAVQRPQYLFPDGAAIGQDNVVLHARSRQHSVRDVAGPLSIKSVVRGQVSWCVRGRALEVDEQSFLVLSDGERYSMHIDEPQPVETCCMFFQRGFVERVAGALTSALAAGLDAPEQQSEPVEFACRIFAGAASPLLARLRSLAERCAPELLPSSFEEDFLLLSTELLSLHAQVRARAARVPAAGAATRRELFRRVETAREYLHGCREGPCSLHDVARRASLSPYHLHRVFTRVHGRTPHTYLTELRLERAQQLLAQGAEVNDVCRRLGWASRSSFSRLFRRRLGVAPSSVRRLARSDTPARAAKG